MNEQLERWRRAASSLLSARRRDRGADAAGPAGPSAPDAATGTPERDRSREGHPIVAGIAALLAVGLVVGGVLGGVAWAGARVLGLGESATVAAGPSSAGDTLFLPRPSETAEPTAPLLTLAPEPGARGGGGAGSAPDGDRGEKRRKKQPQDEIALSAGQTETSVMGQIDLTGTYATGEGAVLQVQRFEAGSWTNFDATVAVANGTFATFVQSGQVGPNRFRVLDTDNGQTSNDVKVTVQ